MPVLHLTFTNKANTASYQVLGTIRENNFYFVSKSICGAHQCGTHM